MATFTHHSASPILAFYRSFLSNSDSEALGPENTDSEDIHSEDLPNSRQQNYLPTSCICIDDALTGGFLYGQINSLAADSAEASIERTLVAMHAVTTHLLSHSKAQAAWIDTEGIFSPALLKEVIALRLLPSLSETQMTLKNILDRVQIMRVFDIQGIVEIVDELKQDFEDKEAEGSLERTKINKKRAKNKRKHLQAAEEEKGMNDHGGMGIVVIDTISQPLLELTNVEPKEFQKEDEWTEDSEKPEAAGLFVALSRSISLLAKERDICILFLNTTSFAPYDGDPFSRWNEVLPSAFATTEERPALGPVYAECVDLSIMISKYPHDPTAMESPELNNAQDTQGSYYKKPAAAETATMIRESELAGFKLDNIIEIVSDRNGPRAGMFGAFVVDGVKLVNAAEPGTGDNGDVLPEVFEELSFFLPADFRHGDDKYHIFC